MTAAIEARDLFRVYSTPEGDAAALQGLSLAVAEREVLVVLGPSGAGKSTLLRLLAALERPSAGTLRVFDADLGRVRGRALAAFRSATLGYVEQHYTRALQPELTARELVGVQLGLAGRSRVERERRADELLERVGLADRRGARPAELSGGEQQRVAVCAALAHRPKLLLADEPTGELDAANASRVYALIGELAREHAATTVIVSHDAASATIADRTVRVRDGRVSEEAASADGAVESLVVGRGGWLRVPPDLLARAGIGGRATARLTDEGIVVVPSGGGSACGDLPVQGGERRQEDRGPSSAGDAPIVASVESVTRRHGAGSAAASVLNGLSAEFPAGTVTAVTGPSGSGKTTLLHLLAGLDCPTSGEVAVLGRDLARLDRTGRAAMRRESIGFIGQGAGLVPFLSALENVESALALRGVAGPDAGERALEALEAVGLADRAPQRVSRLSAGERQRVAIARALAVRPALLLADEPTARLDEANALAVGDLFARVAREHGTAIVCAAHDPVVVEQADRTVSLAPPPRTA